MSNRVFNFNPGPSTLPLDVLKTVQEELLNYRGTGMSILEISHRSPEYEEINDSAISLTRQIMNLGDDYHVIFMGGGASTQFSYVPLNFLPDGKTACYVDTGTWSTKSIKEGKILGDVSVIASSQDGGYTYIPNPSDISLPNNSAYLHITSNNTIKGTQYHQFPKTEDVPLISDMSSDIFTRELDFSQFSMIYAGAQKNIGPSGVVMAIIRDDLLEKCNNNLPTMVDYKTHVTKRSLSNTPPVFAIYMVKLVLQRIIDLGGLSEIEKINCVKKDSVYHLIEKYPEYFIGTARLDSRSWINITLRLPSEDLENKLISEAKQAGFVGLKGHRSVGGIRVSLYNAMTLEGAEKVSDFMANFMNENPA